MIASVGVKVSVVLIFGVDVIGFVPLIGRGMGSDNKFVIESVTATESVGAVLLVREVVAVAVAVVVIAALVIDGL